MAVAQTRMAVALLAERCPDLEVEIMVIRTVGDRVTDRPLSSLGGLGAFTKELDQRIVAGEIDVAVNSLKDMPVDLTSGTVLAAVLPRGPVEDVLLAPVPFDELPPGAVIGSSSVRRRSLIKNRRPDLVVRDLRGNVPTRVRKWKEGEYDAIVLARAGLERLGIEEGGFVLDPAVFTPAPGQGAIAIVCGENSPYLRHLQRLDDDRTRTEVEAERYVLKRLGGGCSVPIGVWAVREGANLRVHGSITADERGKGLFIERTVPVQGMAMGLDEMVEEMRSALGGGIVAG